MLSAVIAGFFLAGVFCILGGGVGLLVEGSTTWAAFMHGAATAGILPGGVGAILAFVILMSGGWSSKWIREVMGFGLGAVVVVLLAWFLKSRIGIQPEVIISVVQANQPPNVAMALAIIEGGSVMEGLGIMLSGGILLWVLFAVAAIAVSWLADENKPMPATVVAIVSAVVLCWLGGINPVTWAQANPFMAAVAIPAYLAIGTLWCMGKWNFSYLPQMRRRIDLVTEEFRRKHEAPTGDDRLRRGQESLNQEPSRDAWLRALSDAGIAYPAVKKVSSNKTRIIAWMAYWPASMAWTVLNDPVRRAFVGIYNTIAGKLQSMADKRFDGVEDAWKSPASDQSKS